MAEVVDAGEVFVFLWTGHGFCKSHRKRNTYRLVSGNTHTPLHDPTLPYSTHSVCAVRDVSLR